MKYLRVSLLEGQGLGNQLWNIAAAYHISKYLGFGLQITNFSRFLAKDFLILPQDVEVLEGDAVNRIPVYREVLYWDPHFSTYVCDFDDQVLNLEQSTEVVGLFQSERYLLHDGCSLSQIFKLSDDASDFAKTFLGKTVLNIRGGEYKKHKNLILPDHYWFMALKRLREIDGVKEICIVTDDQRYARLIFPDAEIVSGTIKNCYSAIYGAKNLIVSNSSFSYFPIMTRPELPIVIAPAHWSRFGNDRKIWVSPANYYNSWMWLDPNGQILDHIELTNTVSLTRDYYSSFNIRTQAVVARKEATLKLWGFGYFKSFLKSFLSIFFPRYF
jgi:hypothetical protein